jgi:phosphohistidine phosphatase SixA
MRTRTRTVIWKAAAALATVITVGACSGTPHPRSITLTFIRHAESQSNAAHVINTDVPGPSLTEEGQGQAEQLAHQLSRNNFDGIYASDMIRTQQTAEPLAHALGKQVDVLPGLREIEAGWYNDTPTKDSLATSHPLPNLGRVVITGNPAMGWTLVDWDGIRDFSY